MTLGVMNLYRVQPGDLGPEELADALVLTDTACALLLDAAHRRQSRLDGRWPEHASQQQPEVHQANRNDHRTAGETAAVALIRLRAYS